MHIYIYACIYTYTLRYLFSFIYAFTAVINRYHFTILFAIIKLTTLLGTSSYRSSHVFNHVNKVYKVYNLHKLINILLTISY